MKRGWLINDRLTCIPGTKTFWHNLLEWIPNLEDKCGRYTPFNLLAPKIEKLLINNKPDYIIRNATYFRKINTPVKTISILQDLLPSNSEQIDVCNNSNIVVYNSPYTKSFYNGKISTKSEIINLGVDFNKFKILNKKFNDELGILPNSILFIGASNITPKGFDIMLDVINNTDYNFCLVMKDNYKINNSRVKCFNMVNHNTLIKIMNSCELLVCTSKIETLHLAGIEAGACGLPIVASNVGVYFNLKSGKWGRNVNSLSYINFINEIKYVKNNLESFKPRQAFLDLGLDTETCKNKWIKLINTL